MQLPHHLLHPSQILRWDGFFQFPDDIHGLAAGMADIGGFAQEGIGRGAQGVLLELADEQQDPSALRGVMDVPAAGRRIGRGGGLALPMEQGGTDGVVLIHGGGRIILVALVEGDQEHVDFLLRQIQHALTHGAEILIIQHGQQLPLGIGAMHIQRAVKAQVGGGINKVNVVVLIPHQLLQFDQHHRTVRQAVQLFQRFVTVPILGIAVPHRHIEHLQHPLLRRRQLREIHIIQPGQNVQQELNPSAGIKGCKAIKHFAEGSFNLFCEILPHAGFHAQAGKGDALTINISRGQMIPVQEASKGQLFPAVLGKRADAADQLAMAPEAAADVLQHRVGSLLFQLNVAALGRTGEAAFNFFLDTVVVVAQQRGKLLLEIVTPVGSADEVQHRQATVRLRRCDPHRQASHP